jgi:uncharacterized protein (DUF3820 family)
MVTTEERKATETAPEKPPKRRRNILVPLFILAAVAAAVIIALLAGGGSDEAEPATTLIGEPVAIAATPGSPEWVMEELAAAIKPLNPTAFEGLTAPVEGSGAGFLEWNLALGMDPVFSDCATTPGSSTANVTCSVTMGEGYFFSRLAGSNVATTVNGGVSNSTARFSVSSWPPPPGLVEAEEGFRDWIRANHPEEEANMFGNDFAGVIKFTKEAGELHTQYADEYLAALATAGSPEGVMERLIEAVQPLLPEGIEEVSAPLDPTGSRFLEWNLALGMEPVFTDCEIRSGSLISSVACSVAMGEEYFFSRVEGSTAETTVGASISNSTGRLSVTGWPPPPGLVAAENDFREWIRANHPEDETAMFGTDYANVIRFSKEAGELHIQYAEEYLASLS